jgi:hypothetical protein
MWFDAPEFPDEGEGAAGARPATDMEALSAGLSARSW